jgi:hypothetical protein
MARPVKFLRWLRSHPLRAYLGAFVLIILPSGLLYPAAQHNASVWQIVLLGLVVLGNLLAVIV